MSIKLPQAFVRDLSFRIREGKDGVQQYARFVVHAEIPDDKTFKEISNLAKKQKGPLFVEFDEAQMPLPAAAGMEG